MRAYRHRTRVRRAVPGLLLGAGLLATASAGWCNDQEIGRQLYLENCAACHGKEGRGDGPGMGALPVKPTDHADAAAMSGHTDEYLFNMIAQGGMGVGRSPFMPAWGEQLSEEQMTALVAYIRSLSAKPKE